MNIPYVMIKCLLFTILIEIIVALILKVKDNKDFINIILANCITNPIVVILPIFIQLKFGLTARWIVLILLEILTVLVEGYIYKKFLNYKKINPFLLSLILNISSYLIGEVINYGLKGVLCLIL